MSGAGLIIRRKIMHKALIKYLTITAVLISGLLFGMSGVADFGITTVAHATTTTETLPSGTITLSTTSSTVKKGEAFTVVCRVSSSSGVLEADFYVDYNTSVLEFVEGGTRATKETGGVHVVSNDNTDSPVRRTFSLQFLGKKEGDATVFIRDGAFVMSGEGTQMSVRTNRLDLVVNETGEPADGGEQTDENSNPIGPDGNPMQTDENGNPIGPDGKPLATPVPANAGGNTRIKSIITNAKEMVPDFDPSVRTYDAVVDPETDTFFIEYELADRNARATVKGNTNLNYGENKVKLVVTAENGKKGKYVFLVTRLSGKNNSEVAEVVTPAATEMNSDTGLDKEENNGYSILLYIIIVILAVFSISMVVLVRRQRREIDNLYLEEEERESINETENDIRGREGGIEGSEIRGEDGKFRYRD